MRLSELSPGAPFTVSRVLVGGEIGKRLADMGFTDGAAGILVRGAFMRGPIQVQIRGYDLLIRRGEAKLIEVGEAPGDEADGPGEAGDSGGAVGGGGEGGKAGRRGLRRGPGRLLRGMFAEPGCCRGAGRGPASRKPA